MPGVPSGRGCDACRKQKKKCDQGKPACSRCARLQIKCVGSGQRRFKFKEQTIVMSSGASSGSTAVAQAHQRAPSYSVLKIPHNATTRLADRFVSVLDVRDLRYSMATYGLFIFDTPRRIGTSKALDASIMAITTAHPTLHTGQQSVEALSCWVRALAALRVALQDPKQATSIETLCAIYYVYIVQTWLGRSEDDHSAHADGMAYILNTMVSQDLKGEFECRMFITLSATVIFESFLNPQLRVNPIIWEASSTYNVPTPVNSGNGSPMQTLQLRSLIDYARILRTPDPDYHEVCGIYAQMRVETTRFGKHISNSADPESESFIPNEERRCHLHAAYGLGLGLSLLFNGILRAHEPLDPGLLEDTHVFVESTVLLAKHGLPFMPLGSSWMSMCLIPAWAVATDLKQKSKVDKAILEYETVPFETGWVEKAYWFQKRLEGMRCRILAARSNSSNASSAPGLEDMPDGISPPPDGCVMF